ncbi:MAG: hypothetical protein E7508_08060 [Ruminococcus sp.]|nr:hypothetical protein [Ruminococcus sp.]
MSDKKSNALSISFRVDSGVIEHNNRSVIAKNVDPARISDNIIYKQTDIKKFYDEIFGEALAGYNAKQKRADKRITDYYEHIKKSKKEKPFYEIIVEFGDVHTCGKASGNWETAKQMLDEYMKTFEERNPNLRVFNAVMHLDEATPHLHIDFVPVAHKAVRGLPLKNSMSSALREQGFSSANRFQNEWVAWEQQEQEEMTKILLAHNFKRDVKNDKHAYLTVDEYKKIEGKKQEIRKLNAQINELKKKNPTELTAEETALINNQNNFLRSEILKRDKKISSLSRKATAAFVPIEVYSEDKLQFVSAELKKRGIPFSEDLTTLHIPEYAKQTVNEIMSRYQPQRLGIRDRIRLDIDRLIYNSDDYYNLFYKLIECGYDIKHGKYVAVKPPYAERFVRLKSLGNEYLPQVLEQRISRRNEFISEIREKNKAANRAEKNIYGTIYHIAAAIKEFRLEPKKQDETKVYTFRNDKNIERLSRQLLTLSEFGLSSREQIYEKAEELKADGSNEAKAGLQRVRELIKVYEEIVEGNYIDNLIKAQKEEQKKSHKR